MKPTVVIVSPHFPPASHAAVHRARLLAKHLPAAGWQPIVVCVDARHHEQAPEPELAQLVPEATEIVRVGALGKGICRVLGIGDVGLRGWLGLREAVRAIAARREVSALLISGGPFYPLLLAVPLRRQLGLGVVVDLQDPWVSAWGAAQPVLSKRGLSHMAAVALEPRALRAASFVTTVSERQGAELRARYPWLDEERMAALPIGGDPEDFEHVRRAGTAPPPGALADDRINLSFVGTVMPRSGPLVRVVLRALARLRCDEPQLGERLRLNFIGTSNQPGDGTHRVLGLARALDVAEGVCEMPRRIGYLPALASMLRSDGLLLIGSDEPHYSASKIYPALASGRPWLSLYHGASSGHALLRAVGGGLAHAWGDGRPEDVLVADVAGAMRRLVLEPQGLGAADPAGWIAHQAPAVAARFARIFERVRDERR